MLSVDKNQTITQNGPGTPMGELIRRFWIPAMLEEELGGPDEAPHQFRLLGQEFVAFRDSNGAIGILDAFCPHRLAPLLLGRNEEAGLRCVYHGWKFDVSGQCVDMPNEPSDSRYKEKVRAGAYPARIAGGIVWAYFGPAAECPPSPPELEWTGLPAGHTVASKRLQENNWVQALEGGIDSSHVGFLHREWADDADLSVPLRKRKLAPLMQGALDDSSQTRSAGLMTQDGAPRFHVQSSDFGMWIGARRGTGDPDRYYWRITPFLLPFYTIIPTLETGKAPDDIAFDGHAWVPIDDHNTWTYNFTWRKSAPFDDDELERMRSETGTHTPGDADYRPTQNMRNMYQIDRDMQRRKNYTGIVGANTQDRAVQELMGPTVDRSREHLGTSDLAIIGFRRLLLRLADELQKGTTPTAAADSEAFRVRSGAVVLQEETDFVKEAMSVLLLDSETRR